MLYNISHILLSYPCLSPPPSLSPLVTTSLFSISVSPFLFCYIFVCIILQIPHIGDTIKYFSFLVWHISLSVIFSRSSMLLQLVEFHSSYSWVWFHCMYRPQVHRDDLSVGRGWRRGLWRLQGAGNAGGPWGWNEPSSSPHHPSGFSRFHSSCLAGHE